MNTMTSHCHFKHAKKRSTDGVQYYTHTHTNTTYSFTLFTYMITYLLKNKHNCEHLSHSQHLVAADVQHLHSVIIPAKG